VLPGPFSGKVQNENKPSQYDRQVRRRRSSECARGADLERRPRLRLRPTNDRLQVFRKTARSYRRRSSQGTFGSGSVWDIGFSTITSRRSPSSSTDQPAVYVLRRTTLEVLSTFRRRWPLAGQFYGAHNLAVDSKGTCTSPRRTAENAYRNYVQGPERS